jgi:acetyltransferase-like isoleucine patch superfamily enzyme
MQRLSQTGLYRIRALAVKWLLDLPRAIYWRSLGLRSKTAFLPRLNITWPHQVSLGADCVIESDTSFKFDGPWRSGPSIILGDRVFLGRGCEFNIQEGITIADEAAIASGCKFIDHDHGIAGTRLDETPGRKGRITIGRNVWLGANVIVLRGVSIGDSAVVGAGGVVTKNIPAGEVWAGIPARRIYIRA